MRYINLHFTYLLTYLLTKQQDQNAAFNWLVLFTALLTYPLNAAFQTS